VGFEPTTTDLGGRCSVRNDRLSTQHHRLSQPSVRTELLALKAIVEQNTDFNLMHALRKNLKLFENVKLVAVAGVPEPGLNRRPENEPKTRGRT
jgi:hypothetical protein